MYYKPSHSPKYKPEFDMRTRGERWHEEVENEGLIKPLITFALVLATVFGIIILFGGDVEINTAEGAECQDADFNDVIKEPAFSAPKELKTDGKSGKQVKKPKTNKPTKEPVSDVAISEESESEPADDNYIPETEWPEVVDSNEPEYYDGSDESSSETPYYPDGETGSLQTNGVEYDGGYRYTWYSQQVLPGDGLDIPGRHVDDEGYVRDEDDRIVLASSDLEYGAEVDTPYGPGKVYDSGCDSGTLDVYTDW